jgi:hypothetical protein
MLPSLVEYSISRSLTWPTPTALRPVMPYLTLSYVALLQLPYVLSCHISRSLMWRHYNCLTSCHVISHALLRGVTPTAVRPVMSYLTLSYVALLQLPYVLSCHISRSLMWPTPTALCPVMQYLMLSYVALLQLPYVLSCHISRSPTCHSSWQRETSLTFWLVIMVHQV